VEDCLFIILQRDLEDPVDLFIELLKPWSFLLEKQQFQLLIKDAHFRNLRLMLFVIADKCIRTNGLIGFGYHFLGQQFLEYLWFCFDKTAVLWVLCISFFIISENKMRSSVTHFNKCKKADFKIICIRNRCSKYMEADVVRGKLVLSGYLE